MFGSAFSSSKTPSHAIRTMEQFANRGAFQSLQFYAESVQTKVGTLRFDREKNVFDLIGISIALANTFQGQPIDRALRGPRSDRGGKRTIRENNPEERA